MNGTRHGKMINLPPISIPPDTMRRIKLAAKKHHVTVSEIVREVLWGCDLTIAPPKRETKGVRLMATLAENGGDLKAALVINPDISASYANTVFWDWQSRNRVASNSGSLYVATQQIVEASNANSFS